MYTCTETRIRACSLRDVDVALGLLGLFDWTEVEAGQAVCQHLWQGFTQHLSLPVKPRAFQVQPIHKHAILWSLFNLKTEQTNRPKPKAMSAHTGSTQSTLKHTHSSTLTHSLTHSLDNEKTNLGRIARLNVQHKELKHQVVNRDLVLSSIVLLRTGEECLWTRKVGRGRGL